MIIKKYIHVIFTLILIFNCSAIYSETVDSTAVTVYENRDDLDNSRPELFDLMFAEAKSFYVDALIAAHFNDSSEVKYCFDRSFEIMAEISGLDTLTLLQEDDFSRFYEKITSDFQQSFSYLNGDSGTYGIASVRDELMKSVIDTVALGHDTLIIVDDRPGHFPLVSSKQIVRIIDYFQNREHERFQQWLNNAGLYKEHMVPILKEFGLPEEIFYLALIESGFNPVAYSYAHASGPWQFIASTGAIFGLKRNWWIDERRDPIKSTYAAAKYLKKLHDEFDDWFLALAAYNTGEMRVWRAIRREGTRDYWKLRSLPRETRNYIPTMMAGMTIALNPEKYGFKNSTEETWKWDEVTIDRCYEFEDIARVSGVSSTILKQNNPELRRWMTPPETDNYILRVPVGKGAGLVEKLAELPDVEVKPQWTTHTVQRGQTLSYIARKYGTSVSALISANNIRNKNQLKVGQVLKIPTSEYYAAATVSSDQDIATHSVKKGETLSEIGEKYGVSVSKIRSLNNLYGKRFIYPGQRLKIPVKKTQATQYSSTPSGKTKIIHVVKKGETLGEIADAYKVGLGNLRAWNNLYGSRFIYPGQKIVIYKSAGS
ncbi:LysM peptidoglycan-binding domain-containing protein [bacterium]|nr:LysM peptidoglycan-binding domain-containing protein [bacterium]MBU1066084.1 LysM peptidoglycan-binding domain-containing protein [bacterium]MBU1634083.1 LysM peptidoglycan-binding domain-containing protein [bacterium]MBU1874516.1 LysM peptidoglycan-binding domain-containing protein [bacterium]